MQFAHFSKLTFVKLILNRVLCSKNSVLEFKQLNSIAKEEQLSDVIYR